MTDLERARSFLADQDYEFVWESPDGYETVWRKANVDVSLDENREWADITVPLSDLPSFLSGLSGLSGLTLEDVEKAVEETRTEVGSWENAECRIGALIALNDFTKRLRQQVNGDARNGDARNREEG